MGQENGHNDAVNRSPSQPGGAQVVRGAFDPPRVPSPEATGLRGLRYFLGGAEKDQLVARPSSAPKHGFCSTAECAAESARIRHGTRNGAGGGATGSSRCRCGSHGGTGRCR
jgi:hypothetical protein